MKNILFINSCVRPESRTNRLTRHLLSKLSGNVTELTLAKEQLKPLDNEALCTRNRFCDAGDFSDPMFKYAKEFRDADEIVIAAPYWDLMFPSSLRTYFELVTVCGLTFSYSEDGAPVGLCAAKSCHYVTTAGGEIGEYDFGFRYVEALCRSFYGIQNIRQYKAEKLDICGENAEEILRRAMAEIDDIRF